MKTNRFPLSFYVLEILGVSSLIPGVMALAGVSNGLPPLLADTTGGLALAATGLALMISGGFPAYITRMMARESA